jgi:hypothetical protein
MAFIGQWQRMVRRFLNLNLIHIFKKRKIKTNLAAIFYVF